MSRPSLDPDVETVKGRILEPLLRPVERGRVESLVESVQADGGWPDVDYADQSTVHWRPIDHLQRLLLMARAHASPESALRDDRRLRDAIFRGLDLWLTRDLRRKWWYEAIGVPGVLSQVLLLLDSELTPAQRTKGLEIVGRATISATGQNLVWMSLIVARRGILERDPDLIAAAFQRIAEEIRISPEEGIQADFSFHQHGPCLYNHGYGAGFATDCSSIALLVAGTRFAFPPEKIALLSCYVLDGSQWMARGGTPEYGAKGREITRREASARYLAQVCRNMLRLPTGREPEFQALLRRTEGDPDAPALEGNRPFYRSGLMVHHRRAYYASARAYSVRNVNTDGLSGCDEGLRSHHVADGCNTLLRTGREYVDIFPVWDWQRIPGTTVELGPQQSGEPRRKGGTAFVGGVSDGDYGLFACDFARDGLTARKAWFFFDAEFVCIGAGITCRSDNPVATTLNQCLLKGAVTLCAEGKAQTPDRGDHVFERAAWVHHDGVAYVFPVGTTVYLRNDAQRGSWKLIGLQSSDEEIARDVFKLWVDHGRSPEGATYAYTVAPGLTPSDAAACAARPGVEVLRNEPGLQAVRHAGAGVTGVAFYVPGGLETAGGLRVAVDRACLVLLREQGGGTAGWNATARSVRRGDGALAASVANPENEALTVRVEVEWQGRGHTAVFDLPGGPEAGRSVTQVI